MGSNVNSHNTKCAVKLRSIKELFVLQFNQKRSKNKELLELGLALGSNFKNNCLMNNVL